jgi:hypothetical protein
VDNRPAVPAAGGPEGEKPVTTDLYVDPEVAFSFQKDDSRFRKTIINARDGNLLLMTG